MDKPMSKELQMWRELERRAHEEEMQMLRELLEEKKVSQATPKKTTLSNSVPPLDAAAPLPKQKNYTELLEREYRNDPIWTTVEFLRKDGSSDKEIYTTLESVY